MPAILDGIRVLDFGHFVAGPYCGALLADLGADVTRIERTSGGDDRYVVPITRNGEGSLFLQVNRGKRSLAIDMSRPEGMAVIRKLIARSDVVIANFSPAAARSFGLDYESVRAIKPDVILTTVSAFDSQSPLADTIGFDGVGQAVSGSVYLTGEPGRPFRSATTYVDFATAISAAFGTLAALIRRGQTGQGGHVEASLAGTALAIMSPILGEQAAGVSNREPMGNRSPSAAPTDIFRAKDGFFLTQVVGNGMFKRWARMIGKPELLDDPQLSNDAGRGRESARLSAYMNEWCADRSREECLAALAKAGIAGGPILSPADVVGDAMGLMTSYFRAVELPDGDRVTIAKSPVRVSESEPSDMRPPLLGEHSHDILLDAGFTADEAAALADAGIVRSR